MIRDCAVKTCGVALLLFALDASLPGLCKKMQSAYDIANNYDADVPETHTGMQAEAQRRIARVRFSVARPQPAQSASARSHVAPDENRDAFTPMPLRPALAPVSDRPHACAAPLCSVLRRLSHGAEL